MNTTGPLKLLRQEAWINGEWTAAEDGRRFAVLNPHDGSLLAHVPDMGAADTYRAIAAAEAAGMVWRAKSAKQRSAILRRWFDLIVSHTEDLASLMTAEQGKPLGEARGEVAYAASFVEWFAEEGKRITGEVLEHPQPGGRIVVLKQPIGVCAAITPWNFPAAMITRKAAPALAAGCTMVVKPAEQTPLTALALGALAEQAGIPPGVLNVVTGSAASAPAIGGAMTESAVVRKLTFTGSTEVGRLLLRQCGGTVKKVSMELGGNAPMIVFDDADIEVAVAGALAAKYRNTGQACIAANRIYVHHAIYEAFAERLAACTKELRVGEGTIPDVQQGPLIDATALHKVETHVQNALQLGARVLTGGRPHSLGGNYYEPTVLVDVTSEMLVAHEETFGPVAPLIRFREEAEVLRAANESELGLAAYLFSRDLSRVWRVAEALEAGMVGVNTGLISNEVAPFGGVKQSGLGREGSRHGIDEFMEIKYVCLGEMR